MFCGEPSDLYASQIRSVTLDTVKYGDIVQFHHCQTWLAQRVPLAWPDLLKMLPILNGRQRFKFGHMTPVPSSTCPLTQSNDYHHSPISGAQRA